MALFLFQSVRMQTLMAFPHIKERFGYRTTRARMEHHAISLIAAADANWTRPFPEIPVVVWPNVEYDASTAASMHLEENGIHESLVLKLSNNLWDVSSQVIWIADGGMSHTEA
jgi:hypothetical protein